ncbi:hypothetical protein RCH09_001335 [Actimicrobium sp. GrIS 1.19]|uniref:hypothetical protein n=1 Tax=Actimicrobium sp. GrIS 1.19 TaxID=3071708 RepID=UPI002E074197|nr:hypothetical protein [Actimicrobium sp. GrIS 1.19]
MMEAQCGFHFCFSEPLNSSAIDSADAMTMGLHPGRRMRRFDQTLPTLSLGQKTGRSRTPGISGQIRQQNPAAASPLSGRVS